MPNTKVEPTINITVRHEKLTDSLRDYVHEKINSIHLEYPKIIKAKVMLEVQKHRHIAEIVLFCSNHIVIDASSETKDMYASIDETISKLERRMRKYKTRLLKKIHHKAPSIRHLDEKVYPQDTLEKIPEEIESDPEPMIIHRENHTMKTLKKEDAILELELSDRPFLIYTNERRGVLQIIYRRADGDYGIIEP